jgi:hypothetical protein
MLVWLLPRLVRVAMASFRRLTGRKQNP